MNFIDASHVPLIGPIVLEALRLPSAPRETIGLYRLKLLTCMCRELEKLVRLSKSTRAQNNARDCGLGDLSEYAWADRIRLNGRHQDGFHFEHTVTVGEMVRALLALSDPTLAEVEDVLSTAKVSWVTKTENNKLDQLGFRSKRPEWRKAYESAGIDLVDE
jgi:hypothetical protein